MLNSPPHTIARRTDPQTSYDAAAKAPTGKMRQFVFDLIEQSGPDGTTIKEMVAANPDIPTSSITSRPNELEKQGLVHYRGDKRDGARIIRVAAHDRGYRLCGCGMALSSFYGFKCQYC